MNAAPRKPGAKKGPPACLPPNGLPSSGTPPEAGRENATGMTEEPVENIPDRRHLKMNLDSLVFDYSNCNI